MAPPLVASVKTSLLHSLQSVFFAGAMVMAVAIIPHLFLKREPLRTRTVSEDSTSTAA